MWPNPTSERERETLFLHTTPYDNFMPASGRTDELWKLSNSHFYELLIYEVKAKLFSLKWLPLLDPNFLGLVCFIELEFFFFFFFFFGVMICSLLLAGKKLLEPNLIMRREGRV
jgi:hypothetical protein